MTDAALRPLSETSLVMRSHEEIWASARDESAFSNGTEFYGWAENWCYAPCQNPVEVAWQRYEAGLRKTPPKDYPGGCPLLQVALLGRTPSEWLDQWQDGQPYPLDRYHCIEFRGPDDGKAGPPRPGPPRPKREPPDMEGLFERPPRQMRMLTAPPARQEVLV